MSLTNNQGIYLSVNEEGINRLTENIIVQIPSLFNIASRDIAENKQHLCKPIKVIQGITETPHVSKIVLPNLKGTLLEKLKEVLPQEIGFPFPDELENLLKEMELNFCAQFKANLDFKPLSSPLPPNIPLPNENENYLGFRIDFSLGLVPLDRTVSQIICSDIITYAIVIFKINEDKIEINLFNLEIDDIKPTSIEEFIISIPRFFINNVLKVMLKNSVTVSSLADKFVQELPTFFGNKITKLGPKINVIIEDDQLKLFVVISEIKIEQVSKEIIKFGDN